MKAWLGPGILVLLVVAAALAGFAAAGEVIPPATDRHAFLPVVERGNSGAAQLTPPPTLGPSPTASRTPTWGPTPAPTATPSVGPTATPGLNFAVLTAGCPYWVGAGATVVFTVGLVNAQDVPVQVSLEDTVPAEMQLVRVYAAVTPTLTAGGFALQMVVPPQRTENVLVWVTVTTVCHCAVTNNVTWAATWHGGGNAGTATSNPIYLSSQPSPTPTPTGSAPPPSATRAPTLGPSPPPPPSATREPTLGPSPTLTRQLGAGPAPGGRP